MKPRVKVILQLLFIPTIFYAVSCDDTVNADLEETLAPYLVLKAVEGASNSSITIQKGEAAGLDSYVAFNISNSGAIPEGLREGWCLERNKPITSNDDTYNGIESCSTYGSETWKPVSYLLSQRSQMIREDPDLTYREFQVAIWSLIHVTSFNLDEVLANNNLSSRLMSEGQHNFDMEKVISIVAMVKENYGSYRYSENSPYLVFARTDDDSQNGGFITCDNPDSESCEVFFSVSGTVYMDANSTQKKESSESGIGNVTVVVIDQEDNEISYKTDSDGYYEFSAFTGNAPTGYTIEVRKYYNLR